MITTIYSSAPNVNVLTGHSSAANWRACLNLQQLTNCNMVIGRPCTANWRRTKHFQHSNPHANIHLKVKRYSHIEQTTPQDPHKNIQWIFKRYCRPQVKWTVAGFSPWKLDFIPVKVQFVMHKVAPGQDSLLALLCLPINYHSISAAYAFICHPRMIQQLH